MRMIHYCIGCIYLKVKDGTEKTLDQTAFNHILSRVEKPARYIGGEWNSIVKEEAELRFALLFPDVYEIGRSHLGSRILYHALNST